MRRAVFGAGLAIGLSLVGLTPAQSCEPAFQDPVSGACRTILVDPSGSTTSGSPVKLTPPMAGQDTGNDVLKTEHRFTYTAITSAAPTTTVIKSGAGFLHRININKLGVSGVIQCFDNTSGTGTIILTLTNPLALLQNQLSMEYNVMFSVGLTCVTSIAAQDITVSWR